MTTAGRPEELDVAALVERLRRPPCWGPNEQGDLMVDMTVAAYEQDLDTLLDRLAEAEQAVARVEALHRPDKYEHESPGEPHIETYCYECSNYGRRSFVRHPCATARAIQGFCTCGWDKPLGPTCPDCGGATA